MTEELGERLQQARKAKKLSLEAAAAPAKISPAYLHKLEAGRVNTPSPRVLLRLGEALELRLLGADGPRGLRARRRGAAQGRRAPPRPPPPRRATTAPAGSSSCSRSCAPAAQVRERVAA